MAELQAVAAEKKRERRTNQSPDNGNKNRSTRHEAVAKIGSQSEQEKGIEECRYEQWKAPRSDELFSYLRCWTALALVLASRKFLRAHRPIQNAKNPAITDTVIALPNSATTTALLAASRGVLWMLS
jgi:hypothetical protein